MLILHYLMSVACLTIIGKSGVPDHELYTVKSYKNLKAAKLRCLCT